MDLFEKGISGFAALLVILMYFNVSK